MPAPDRAAALAELCDDLVAEHAELDAVVAPLVAEQWDLMTPAEGWAIRDQIHHLGWFDRNGVSAIEDPDGFAASTAELVSDFDGFEVRLAAEARSMTAAELVQWWRAGRPRIVEAIRAADPSLRVP